MISKLPKPSSRAGRWFLVISLCQFTKILQMSLFWSTVNKSISRQKVSVCLLHKKWSRIKTLNVIKWRKIYHLSKKPQICKTKTNKTISLFIPQLKRVWTVNFQQAEKDGHIPKFWLYFWWFHWAYKEEVAATVWSP